MDEPKKDYCEPMHTAEHILNQTMIRMFGCKRSINAHIERKKSKCDYFLSEAPTEAQMQEVERLVNEEIAKRYPVTIDFVSLEEAAKIVDLSKLPDQVGDTIRIIRVGDYDSCACIGQHVQNTSEIGTFKMLNWDFEEGRLRLRFKVL
ncbi:MAG: hypothetical protein PHV20_13600 [Bacteroidales bacterium]|nr:hypothetical protein [Bacteroidales bacterium]